MPVPFRRAVRLHRTRITPPLIVLALTAAALLNAQVPANATGTSSTGGSTTSKPASTQAIPLTTATAAVKAKATGKAVIADALTTATETIAANPNGTFTLTQWAEPVRARVRGGAWESLDATLHASGSTVIPALTTSPVVLSNGGRGPLATLTNNARTFSMTWPTALPVPTLSSNTATYANVLPSVDLVVTVSPQGAVGETLVIKTAQAAANPALASLHIGVATSPGLAVSTDAAGNIAATAAGRTLFTAPSPQMWDSTTTPAAALPKSAPTTAIAGATTPATPSTPTGPGSDARTAPITVAVTPAGLTLTPDKALLTAPGTTFPVYEDPNVSPVYTGTNTGWASVSDYYPAQNYYDSTPDPTKGTMQVGYSGTLADGGMWSRSLMNFTVPASLKGASIYSASVGITETYGASCTPEQVNLYAPGSDTLSSANATWNDWVSNLGPEVASDTPADTGWSTSCPGGPVPFTGSSILSTVTNDINTNKTAQTFALVANNESSTLGWKKFQANTANLVITYAHAPNNPTQVSTSPGGVCQTGAPANDTIGNDDIAFSALPTDPDPGTSLTTEFVIDNYQGSVVYDSATQGTNITGNTGNAAVLTLKRATLQALNTNGATTADPYSWYTVITNTTQNATGTYTLTNPASTTAQGTKLDPCTFVFNPNGPPAPTVSAPTPANPVLGQTAAFTITPAAGLAPAQYTYQLNSGPTTTIVATGSAQTLTLRMTHLGPNILTVYAIDIGGNIGPATSSNTFSVAEPTTPYADGDINGDGIPDLLYPGTAADPGLWLATGNGPGTLNPPVNIGENGTGINGTSGTSNDWTGAEILHGNFSGDNVQDVMAYYPPGSNYPGTGYLVYGNGDASATNPLSPLSGSAQSVASPNWENLSCENPSDLVAAGDASNADSPGSPPDLIGIAATTSTLNGNCTTTVVGYELDLYTGSFFTGYGITQTLATTSPDGSSTDWNDYTLATAQPGGIPVLFALNNTTGNLYESTNLTNSTTAPIGTTGTWTQITVPWTNAAIPHLTSGDINTNGQIELWSVNPTASLITAYTLSSTTLTREAITTPPAPTHDWPLNDGNSATTAADVAGGSASSATLSTTGATWTNDAVHGTVLGLNAANTGYLTLPSNLLQSTTSTLSLQFKTTTTHDSGILFSTDTSTPAGLNAAAMPVMYVGTDGRLYAQFWTGAIDPIISAEPVNDGLWHSATLVGAGTTQTLYLDGHPVGTHAGTIANLDPDDYAGAGVFNTSPWINAPGTAGTARADYFTGDLANIQYTPDSLTAAQLQTTTQTTFTPNTDYPSGSVWYSQNTTMTFTNGLLAITDNNTGAALFTRGTAAYPNAVLAFQTDGNLVIYPNLTDATATPTTGAIWAVNKDGATFNNGDALLLQANGNLALYPTPAAAQTQTGPLWTSGTNNPPAAGYYQAITPKRILDTRNGTGGTTGPINANATVTLQVTGGISGVPTTNVTGVVVTLTAISTTGSGYLTAYPDTTAMPATSNVNYAANQVIAGSAIIPVGPDGIVKITNNGATAGPVQILTDITGYFTTNPQTGTLSTYVPVTPTTRILDTRSNLGITGKLSPGTVYTLTIAGANGIPADTTNATITGVAINLTTANTTGSDNLTAYADGTPLPLTTNANFTTAAISATLAAVPVGTDGKIDLDITGTQAGTTDLIGDVTGYFTTSTTGQKYHPILFNRILDTRTTTPVAADASIPATEGTPLYPLAISLITNVTVTGATATGVVIAYPDGATAPSYTTTSNLNFTPNQTVANLTIVPTTDNTIQLENASTGTIQLIADCLGYFANN